MEKMKTTRYIYMDALFYYGAIGSAKADVSEESYAENRIYSQDFLSCSIIIIYVFFDLRR